MRVRCVIVGLIYDFYISASKRELNILPINTSMPVYTDGPVKVMRFCYP